MQSLKSGFRSREFSFLAPDSRLWTLDFFTNLLPGDASSCHNLTYIAGDLGDPSQGNDPPPFRAGNPATPDHPKASPYPGHQPEVETSRWLPGPPSARILGSGARMRVTRVSAVTGARRCRAPARPEHCVLGIRYQVSGIRYCVYRIASQPRRRDHTVRRRAAHKHSLPLPRDTRLPSDQQLIWPETAGANA